jgi:hypothetical protein
LVGVAGVATAVTVQHCPEPYVRAGYCVLPVFECRCAGEFVEEVRWVLLTSGEMRLSGVGAFSVMHAGRSDEP